MLLKIKKVKKKHDGDIVQMFTWNCPALNGLETKISRTFLDFYHLGHE